MNYNYSAVSSKIGRLYPRFLWFLIVTYCMITILANWFCPQLFYIGGLYINAGIFILIPSFLLSAIIAEIYGYKHARCVVWCGCLFNIILIIYGRVVTHMSSPEYAVHNNILFDSLLSPHVKFVIAAGISYFTSAFLSPYLMSKLKLKTQGYFVGIRLAFSAGIAIFVNSIVFCLIVFFENEATTSWSYFILTSFLSGAFILLVGVPIATLIIKMLKKAENLDIYDDKTNFSILKFETRYSSHSNKFNRQSLEFK